MYEAHNPLQPHLRHRTEVVVAILRLRDCDPAFLNPGYGLMLRLLVPMPMAIPDAAFGGFGGQPIMQEVAFAAPVAPMAAGPPPPAPPSGGAPVPKLRSKFPESWIWADILSKSNGEVVYEATVPDTITSWVTSAFAVHDQAGLGVADETVKLQVFRPFFIRLNLPYSVKRGEKLALQVLVFNYQKSPQTVTLTLKHNGNSGFDFVKKNGGTLKSNTKKPNKNYNVRSVKVPGNGGSASVFFPIVASKLGEIKLNIKAIGNTASDAVEKPLLVEPEGFRVDKNIPIMIDLSEAKSFNKTVSLNFPGDAVPDSQNAKVAIIGDIMGPVLSNIESLVRMPYGCGEQNMLNFVPNIVVMRYLKATDRLTSQLKTKATKYMEAGYQRELTYKRNDNSYSAFGQSDETGSTWLTAFVVRSFKQAEPYIFVDMEKVGQSLQYLNNQQAENGEFKERGEVHHKDMQGGASEGGVPMTAYVLVTILENGGKNPSAVRYIEQRLDKIKDESYSLALATYALHLAKSSKKDKAIRLLEAKAKEENGMKYWSDKVGEEKTDEYYWSGPRPVDVETTGYALLSYVLRNQISEGLPIIRWLTTQRNAYGGYSSTQDTVVALQALGFYAEKAYSPSFNVDIDVKNGQNRNKIKVEPKNALVLQTYEIENLNSPITLKAKGSGVVFAQVQYNYHLTKLRDDLPFDCDQTVIQQKNGAQLTLGMCCKYKKGGKSNMAVMTVGALSGHSFDSEDVNKLTQIDEVQRVELEKGDSVANLYFKSLTSRSTCVNLTSEVVFPVSDQKDGVIELYDYYEPIDRIEATYSAKRTRSMLQNCPTCWDGVGADDTTGGGSGRRMNYMLLALMVVLLIALDRW